MIMPYLSFAGDCEEAFRLYQRAFGGQNPLLARYSDAPESVYPNLREEQRDKIMHGHVMLTETGGISGADIWEQNIEHGSAMSIHVYCHSMEAALKAFETLSEGGTVIGELQANPPPHDNGLSGMVRDRFGFTWVLSAEIA